MQSAQTATLIDYQKGGTVFFKRDLTATLKRFAKFPVVALLGPRQSGKTTLVKHVFKKHTFVTLEDPDMRDFATRDPNRFLRDHENKHGVIIDEFQYAPQILSYIQMAVDEKNRPGYFVLTGSQNFLTNQAVTQSLAGRVGIATLLPFSHNELFKNKLLTDVDETMLHGGYPRIYAERISSRDLYSSYVHTYLERDVRQLINVGNLRNFQKFMKLCAGRIGQLLNVTDLATNCGISRNTADEWISLLEASYIIFLLKPHFGSFNKRMTKTPKLYFYDTGLACSLLGIRSANDLKLSPFRGHLFESLVIADFYKQYYNLGIEPPLYFWRDQNGRIEIDCIIEVGTKVIPVEIKSGETINTDFFTGITEWNEMAKAKPDHSYVVYGGALKQSRSQGNVIGWQSTRNLISKLERS